MRHFLISDIDHDCLLGVFDLDTGEMVNNHGMVASDVIDFLWEKRRGGVTVTFDGTAMDTIHEVFHTD